MARKHLSDLTPSPRNPRRHTPRNIGMIEESLHEFGALRGIVVDEDGVILAGNGVVEAAMQAGFSDVEVVDIDDPNTIVAFRASHLTDEQKRRYEVADNRTTDLSEWDPDVLTSMIEDEGIDLADFFFDSEMGRILGDEESTARHAPSGPPEWQVTVTCHSPEDAEDVRELLRGHGYEVKERRK